MQSQFSFFFFDDTSPTEIYTLSLHDALPISRRRSRNGCSRSGSKQAGSSWGRSSTSCGPRTSQPAGARAAAKVSRRSEEHTSELQSQSNLVCRLLLEKKKKKRKRN